MKLSAQDIRTVKELLRHYKAARTAKEYSRILDRLNDGTITTQTIKSRSLYLQVRGVLKFIHKTGIVDNTFDNFGISVDSLEQNEHLKDKAARNHVARKVKEKVLTDEQFDAFLAALPDSHNGNELNLAAVISRYSGARLSEVLAMHPEQLKFNEDDDVITWAIPNGKGNKSRLTWLPGSLWHVLQDFSGFTISVGYVTVTTNRIMRKIGLRSSFHGLRHTMATNAIRKGMPINELADILGHSDINTTRIYIETAKECPESMKKLW